ncbi:hypothetical protein T492DRAFT_1046465 [Pavlovales sp. CCMP2436]|nr:hypothetical protein T492DRAFT_1046465 [Pavlovales sp. CCMP2436]
MRMATAQNQDAARDRERKMLEAKRETLAASKKARAEEQERMARARAEEETKARAAREAAAAVRAAAAAKVAGMGAAHAGTAWHGGKMLPPLSVGAGGSGSGLASPRVSSAPSPRTPGASLKSPLTGGGPSDVPAIKPASASKLAAAAREMPAWLKSANEKRQAAAGKAPTPAAGAAPAVSARPSPSPSPKPAAEGGGCGKQPARPSAGARETDAQSSSSSGVRGGGGAQGGSEDEADSESAAETEATDAADALELEAMRIYALAYNKAEKEWRYLVSAKLPSPETLAAALVDPPSRLAEPVGDRELDAALPVCVWALASHLKSDELLAAFEARIARQVLPEFRPGVGLLADVRNVDPGFLFSWCSAVLKKQHKGKPPPRKGAEQGEQKSGALHGDVLQLDALQDGASAHWVVEYSDFISPEGIPLQETVPPSRLRQKNALAPADWVPVESEVVEVVQDDVWWEAIVMQVERAGTGTRPVHRVEVRNRMTWEKSWVKSSSCRPSAAHLHFMRAGVTLLDARQPRPKPPAPGKRQATASAAGAPVGAKQSRAPLAKSPHEDESEEHASLRAELGVLLQAAAEDSEAVDEQTLREAIRAARGMGIMGDTVVELERRLAAASTDED